MGCVIAHPNLSQPYNNLSSIANDLQLFLAMSGALLSTRAVVMTFWPQARPARILMQFLYGTSQL